MIFALVSWLSLAPIIGGSDDTSHPAVVAIAVGGGQCSGIVVAPRVVVTAAHCIAPGAGTVDLGGVTANVVRTWVDRYYTGDVEHDLAALWLDRDAGIAALPIAAPIAGAVTLVGFGATVAGGPRGVRHAVAAELAAITARSARAGQAGATTCTGDSGGAAIDGTGALVGIITAGDEACTAPSYLVRPDSEPQLAEVIAAWSSAITTPCGFEGTCAESCPSVDLDCPLAGLAGATCSAATECESRLCAGDARGRFCSASCAVDSDCAAPFARCAGAACAYAGDPPGIAGAHCATNSECRSGLCDLAAASCTVACGSGGSCPSGFSCEPVADQRACTTSGGCAAGDGGGGWLVVASLAFMVRRRKAH